MLFLKFYANIHFFFDICKFFSDYFVFFAKKAYFSLFCLTCVPFLFLSNLRTADVE